MSVMVIVTGNRIGDPSTIFHTNALRKDMNPSILSPVMGKKQRGRLGFFSIG